MLPRISFVGLKMFALAGADTDELWASLSRLLTTNTTLEFLCITFGWFGTLGDYTDYRGGHSAPIIDVP